MRIFLRRIQIKMMVAILCILGSGFFSQTMRTEAAYAYQDPYPQKIESGRFAEIAEDKIRAALIEANEGRRYELHVLRLAPEMKCPAGTIICEADLPQGLKYSGSTPVQITVYVDGRPFRRAVAYMNLRVYENVVVAARDLAIEQVVWSGDFRIEEREVAQGVTYVSDSSSLEGKVPSRVIRVGTPVLENMFRNPIAFEVGAELKLVFQKGGFEVSAEGIAMQRGRIGEVIRVRNARSNRVLRARVIDASTAEVL